MTNADRTLSRNRADAGETPVRRKAMRDGDPIVSGEGEPRASAPNELLQVSLSVSPSICLSVFNHSAFRRSDSHHPIAHFWGIRCATIPATRTLTAVGLLACLFLLAGTRHVAAGEEQASSAVANDSEPAANVRVKDAAANERAAPADPVDDAQARRALSSAVVMLAAIMICGVGLIAMVLLWGNRARRIARQSLPKVMPRDELWYLKRGATRPPDDRDELEETFPGPKP